MLKWHALYIDVCNGRCVGTDWLQINTCVFCWCFIHSYIIMHGTKHIKLSEICFHIYEQSWTDASIRVTSVNLLVTYSRNNELWRAITFLTAQDLVKDKHYEGRAVSWANVKCVCTLSASWAVNTNVRIECISRRKKMSHTIRNVTLHAINNNNDNNNKVKLSRYRPEQALGDPVG